MLDSVVDDVVVALLLVLDKTLGLEDGKEDGTATLDSAGLGGALLVELSTESALDELDDGW